MVRYLDLVFQPGMLIADRDDGKSIQFTRQERAVLLRLTQSPLTLVTRAQLLHAIGDDHGSICERNVDYLVNRLRRRLGDSARSPRFVATQYGEGYVWIAEPTSCEGVDAFLLIGPVFGLKPERSLALPTLEQLAAEMRRKIGGERVVVCRPDWRPGRQAAPTVRYSLECGTHEEDGSVHLALALKEVSSSRLIKTIRVTLQSGVTADISPLADAVISALWRHVALSNHGTMELATPPAHLRMHDASLMLTADTISWRESGPRLEKARETLPSDPKLMVTQGLNHYARLLQSLGSIKEAPIDDDEWERVEDEIEVLALRALPKVFDDPHLLLGVAKLLRFIDRGYLDLSERLTEKAFAQSTAFAAAFPMKAQIAASRGDIECAVDLYDKALELSEKGSEFEIYLLVLKAVAVMAGNRRTELDELTERLFDSHPLARTTYGLFFVPDNPRLLHPAAERAIAGLSPALGRHFTAYLFRVSARQFVRTAHKRNVVKGLTAHLIRHHGVGAINPLLTESMPELLRPH